MLIFNAQRIFGLRNISHASIYLQQQGFSRVTTRAIVNNEVVAIKVKHLERLCRLFNCTPNDFFEWQAMENEQPLPENHQLKSLQREKVAQLAEMFKDLPLEKLGEVENFLDDLKKR